MNEEPELEAELVLDAEEEVEDELANLPLDSAELEAATGLHVITITYDDDSPEPPKLNLGGTGAWLAFSILSAALETLSMIRSPLTVEYDGRTLFSQDMFIEEDDAEFDEDED